MAEPGGGNKKLICNPQAGSEILIFYLAAVFLLLSQKLENISIHELDFHLYTSSHLNFKCIILCMFRCLPHMAALWIVRIKIKPNFHFPEEWCSSHWWIMLPELPHSSCLMTFFPPSWTKAWCWVPIQRQPCFSGRWNYSWVSEFVKHFGIF